MFILADDIQSDDGVTNAAIREAALRLDEQKKEIETLKEELQLALRKAASDKEKWEKCADRLFVYAEEVQATIINRAQYETVCEDIEQYKILKRLK